MFINKSLLKHHPACYLLFMTAFILQWQSWVVATQVIWPHSLSYLLSGLLQEKLVHPVLVECKQQPHWGHTCVPLLQSCLTLCDPMDFSWSGSSVCGILQARILEWVAIPSSRRSSLPRDWTCLFYVSCIGRHVLYQWQHLGSPKYTHIHTVFLT